MPGQKSWSCKLLREASYPLGLLWYTSNLGTISGTLFHDLEFDLEGRIECKIKVVIIVV